MENTYHTRIHFGKHRGTLVENLPDDYLAWLKAQDFLREPLRSAVDAEFRTRTGAHHHGHTQRPEFLITGADRQLTQRLVESGRRSLAKSAHPDAGAGGDLETMKRINTVADSLLEALR